MTLHIYQAQLLHYLTEDDVAKRLPKMPIVDKGVTLMPVVAGVNVYPEYIANGALVVDDVTGLIVDYGSSETILTEYA